MRPNISFQERAKLAMELLAKQAPVTLEEARAQVLWLKSKCSTGADNPNIKFHLKMYFLNWTKEQIEDGFNQIQNIISREGECKDAKQAIANYLKRSVETSSYANLKALQKKVKRKK